MSFVRARALRGLQNGLRSSGLRPALRGNTLKHSQLQAKRYASSEGGHQASSDLPWLISALVITPVASWYLWPSPAEHHGAHGGHDEHGEEESHDSEESEDAPEEDSASKDEEPPKQDEEDDAPKADDKEDNEDSGDDDKEAKEDKADAPKGDDQPADEGAEKQEGQAEGSSDSEDSSEKKGNTSGVNFKGKLRADTAGASDTRKSEPDGKGGFKKRIDSGLQKDLTQGPTADGQDSDPGKRDFTTMAGKQQGMSNTQTRHSIPIHQDPEKSKKSDGTPETAKAVGTVDPSKR